MNVVLSSIDCCRWDALNHSFFEKQKDRGSYFDTCITQASFTSPSHTSMLTGTYPYNHGVRWLVDYESDSKYLQEVLSDAGYNTAAFIGGFPLPTGDMDRGFDTFENLETMDDEMEGRKEYGPANVLVNRALNWLREHEGEDNFVFLHFFDLHLTFRSEFGKREKPEFDDQHTYENVEQYIGRLKRRYYEEVEFVGKQLNRLTDLVDIDINVTTADHGSKLPQEHGYPWVYNHEGERVGSHLHGADLYDNNIRVPLIFTGDAFPDVTVHRQVRSIDIVPTLLDCLNIDSDEDVDGRSLLNEEYPDTAYSETYHGQLTKANKFASEMAESYEFGWSDLDSLVCLRTNEWKLVCKADGGLDPVEMYHIAQDPAEGRNLLDDPEYEKVRDELFAELESMLDEDGQMKKSGEKVDKKTQERLEDLGYL